MRLHKPAQILVQMQLCAALTEVHPAEITFLFHVIFLRVVCCWETRVLRKSRPPAVLYFWAQMVLHAIIEPVESQEVGRFSSDLKVPGSNLGSSRSCVQIKTCLGYFPTGA